MNRPPPMHGRAISSSVPDHESQPSASPSDHWPRQYEPGYMPLTPALLPAELNHVMPAVTALFTTWSIGPVPSPAPSYWAVSDRLMIETPFAAK